MTISEPVATIRDLILKDIEDGGVRFECSDYNKTVINYKDLVTGVGYLFYLSDSLPSPEYLTADEVRVLYEAFRQLEGALRQGQLDKLREEACKTYNVSGEKPYELVEVVTVEKRWWEVWK